MPSSAVLTRFLFVRLPGAKPGHHTSSRIACISVGNHLTSLASLLQLDSRRTLDALALVLGRLSRRIIHLPTGFQSGRNPGGNFIWLPLRRPARSIRL